MIKKQNPLILALKGIIFIYLPVMLLLFIIYNVIFGMDINLHWGRIMIYEVIIGVGTLRNYIYKSVEMNINNFDDLEDLILKGRWKITEKSENKLLVKPTFDFPFRLFIEDTVQIDYHELRSIISGPDYYVNNLIKEVNGKGSIWTKRITGIVRILLIITLVSVPVLADLGVNWEINKLRHGNYVKDVEMIEINPAEVLGNTVENTNNHGAAVENNEYIFYINNHLNLIRADKDFQNKKYLIQKPSGDGIGRLNIAGDWIYYSSGETLNRISLDGKDNETIYKLGFPLDIHMKDDWIYFVNFSDDVKVYKMDINGRNLDRFIDVLAVDIALYNNRMIFSYEENGNGYVESIGLDGSDRRLEFEDMVRDLIMWEGYYYYIGDDYRLYRRLINDVAEAEILIDDKVSSYTITDVGIYYSIHSDAVGYPGKGLYKVGLDGTDDTLIVDADGVGRFAKIGNYLLFHLGDDQLLPRLHRLNLLNDEIELME